jgi:hypothetical protein
MGKRLATLAATAALASAGAEALAEGSLIPSTLDPKEALDPGQSLDPSQARDEELMPTPQPVAPGPEYRPVMPEPYPHPQVIPEPAPEETLDPVLNCSVETAQKVKEAEQILELTLPHAQGVFNSEMPRKYGVPPLDFSMLTIPSQDGLSVGCAEREKATRADHPAVDGKEVWARRSGGEWRLTPVATGGNHCKAAAALAVSRACEIGLNGPGEKCEVMTGISEGLPGGVARMVGESVWESCLERQQELLQRVQETRVDPSSGGALQPDPGPYAHLDGYRLKGGNDHGLIPQDELENFTGEGTINVEIGGVPMHMKAKLENGRLISGTVFDGKLHIKDLSGKGIEIKPGQDLFGVVAESCEILFEDGGASWTFAGEMQGKSGKGVINLSPEGSTNPITISAETFKWESVSSRSSLPKAAGEFLITDLDKKITVEGLGAIDLSIDPNQPYEIESLVMPATVTYGNGNKLIGSAFEGPYWMPVNSAEYKLEIPDRGYVKFVYTDALLTVQEYKQDHWEREASAVKGAEVLFQLGSGAEGSGSARRKYKKVFPEWNIQKKISMELTIAFDEESGPSFIHSQHEIEEATTKDEED